MTLGKRERARLAGSFSANTSFNSISLETHHTTRKIHLYYIYNTHLVLGLHKGVYS
ncbi:hypothetical protein HanXRQr2_Chr14g0641621 [Helianthus annuus]|uniref:Uncharacterized protein n=1 Tax=Helianthus annuus TaxID=4232 RepID=A0A9K3E8C6_HELAN|nr:hypothetical protein HanXRQr2_Chr14g0641621 [Helianthus annuus]